MHARLFCLAMALVGTCAMTPVSAQRVRTPSPVVVPQVAQTYQQPVATPYGGYAQQGVGVPAAPYVPPPTTFDSYNCAPVCPPVVPVTPVVVQPTNHFHLFGQFLYLRPNDAAMVSYALPVNGLFPPPPTPPPAGPVAVVDPGYKPGFRVGGGYSWSQASEIVGAFTWYENDANSSVTEGPPGPNVLLPLVFHPATLAADTIYTAATAQTEIDLKIIDLDYRRTLADNWLRLSYIVGGRYVDLDQSFSSVFTGGVLGPPTQTVNTQVDFDGGGIRGGINADITTPQTGLFGYANGAASFIAGEFTSSYLQTDGAAMPTIAASTSRTDDRVVPILDIELGVGWQSESGAWRVTAGYLFSAWFNVVSNDEFIQAVQAAQFSGVSDTLTFDGLTAQVDWRF